MSMALFIISHLLIALSLNALGGTSGEKQAKKKAAALPRQIVTGDVIADVETKIEASPEKMVELWPHRSRRD
jgi:heptaprenylglyceryl phosphate synthase